VIGILTFHRGPNHGGYLQAAELVAAVRRAGHDVEIINYQNARHHAGERFRPWVYRRPAKLWHAWRKYRAFRRALTELPMGEFTMASDSIDWNRYDAVLVGSDVVWDYSQTRLGQDPVYFGSFRAAFRGRLASYAPSCGMVDPRGAVPEWVEAGLGGFDRLSARDETTRSLVQRSTGHDCPLVVDPTWLPIAGRGDEHSARGGKPGGYLAVYAFSIDAESARMVREYARASRLRIIASGYPHSWADEFRSSLTPSEWIEYLRNAAAVFVGTFHGALYSIRLGKRFAVLPNDHIRAKLDTPIRMAGLEDRCVACPEAIAEALDRTRDLGETLDRLQAPVALSREYLGEVLEGRG